MAGQLCPESTAAKVINVTLFLSIIFRCVSATNHTVGGSSGWDLASDVKNWASKTLFVTGDNLVFVYKPDHNVVEVGERGYALCQIRSPIHTHGGGNTVIPLTKPGIRYFVCGKQSHCFQGLKTQIDVLLLPEKFSSSPRTETGSGAAAPIGSDDQMKNPDATPNLSRHRNPRRVPPPPPPSQRFRRRTPPSYEYHPSELPPSPSQRNNGKGAFLTHYWYVLFLVLGFAVSMIWFFRVQFIYIFESCGGCLTSQINLEDLL